MTDCNQQEYINNNLESDLKSIETINQSGDSFKTMEEIEVNNFSYDGQQVVPAEYFAHRYEPSITFNQGKISLNTAFNTCSALFNFSLSNFSKFL